MRRTAALAAALPIALLLAGGFDGPPDPDTRSDPPLTVMEPARPEMPSPSPQEEPEPRDHTPEEDEDEPDGTEVGPEGAPDAEGTVDSTDGSEDEDPGTLTRGPVEDTFMVATVPERGAVVGTGPRWRYTIEVDPTLGVDVEELAVEVRAALTDDRSWVRTRTLEQVDDPVRARIRVVLASPDTVDELCGRVGLRTAGIYSCWNGRFAALNSWRWEVGAEAFDDITTYRNYLVNHEFGHGLGYGHISCPAPGAPAPVMMQQSKGVGTCIANGWPYP